MFYAQLDNENICVWVSQLSGDVTYKTMIALPQFDTSLLGKQYQDGKWINIPQPKPEPEPLSNTEQAILETAVNIEYLVSLNNLTL